MAMHGQMHAHVEQSETRGEVSVLSVGGRKTKPSSRPGKRKVSHVLVADVRSFNTTRDDRRRRMMGREQREVEFGVIENVWRKFQATRVY